MELSHEFEVPVSADDAYAVLTDIERIAPCMPGATLDEVEGDQFTGRVKVKVGPVQMTYRGTAEFKERDAEHHRAIIVARGQETRGGGTAEATITATLTAVAPDRTGVTVHTDLVLTGKPAQFGRGVIGDVGDKLLGKFADCLSEELASGGAEPEVETAGAEGVSGEPLAAEAGEGSWEPQARERPAQAEPEAIDLLDVAGGSVAKRLAPVVALIAVVAAIVWWRSRR